jgi:multiple antibiotic resistance protein
MAGILEAFVLLLGIIDPLASLAAFLSLTKKMDAKEKVRVAHKAVLVAAAVFFIFAIGGQPILNVLGVNMESFRAAGGIVLILLGIQMGLGISFPKESGDDISEIAVVIGTPLITGPATITTAIILSGEAGVLTTAVAGSAALLITLAVLSFSAQISKFVGRSGLQIMSTMMGIITMAWGLQFLLSGINAFKP